MERIFVLWRKDGTVYRAYAPRYPQIRAEGGSEEEVAERITPLLRSHLGAGANGNGAGIEVVLAEDVRREDMPADLRKVCEEMTGEMDLSFLDVVAELNRRLLPGMTQPEMHQLMTDILLEEEKQGRKWYSSEETRANLDDYQKKLLDDPEAAHEPGWSPFPDQQLRRGAEQSS